MSIFDNMYEQASEMISDIADFTEGQTDAEVVDKADEMYWTLDNFKTMIEEMKGLMHLDDSDDEDEEYEDEDEENWNKDESVTVNLLVTDTPRKIDKLYDYMDTHIHEYEETEKWRD